MKNIMSLSRENKVLIGIAVISVVLIMFSSVKAAESSIRFNEVDSWTSSGYRLVTVGTTADEDIGSSLSQAGCVLDTNGMVSHWPLDDNSGSTTFDDVVGSIDGTCTGGTCPTRTQGKFGLGGAYNFVASEKDVISVPADVDPGKTLYDTMVSGDFSAGVWVKTTQYCAIDLDQKNKVFFGRYRQLGANGTWWLGCTEPGGVAVFRLRDSTNAARQIDGTTNITDGQWHFIVGVRDSVNDKNYLYVDGKLEGMLDSPAYSGVFSSDMPITMGAYDEPTNYYLDGTLDDVVLYDRVLAPQEISTYFDACNVPTSNTYLPLAIR